MDLLNWPELLQILKQYGPVVGLLLFLIFWQWRLIAGLLNRNAQVYEGHIKQLAQTQERLLTKLIGPQPSSVDAPTVKQIEHAVRENQRKEEDRK